MALSLLALLVSSACTERANPVRSGALNVTKDCSTYSGAAGQICTITASNLADIEVGSTVTYATAAVGTDLDTDIVLDSPGPGSDLATGHCKLSLATGIGACTFSGGTGKFTGFSANVAVSHRGGTVYAWDGTYSYSR
jgi:hypothetical protein